MNNEDIKDIIEILELAKDEIENNDENITATLDLQDLKSLRNLYNLYNKEKDLNNELQIRYKIEHEKYLKEKEKNKSIVYNYEQVVDKLEKKNKIIDKMATECSIQTGRWESLENQEIIEYFTNLVEVEKENK